MKTLEQMIRELYVVILGVPGTDEKGMAGDITEIKEHLSQLNGAVKTNTAWRKAMCWTIGIIIAALTAIAYFG